MIAAFITIVGVIVIVVGVANALIVLIQLGAAFVIMADRARGQDARNLWRRVADAAPSVAIVVPAYNEAATIVESLSSLLALEYPTFELIVVNDGSRRHA